MNLHLGAFRACVAIGGLWIIGVLMVSATSIWTEFSGPPIIGAKWSREEIAVPGACTLATGDKYWRESYLEAADSMCWWRLSDFRTEYPYYNATSDFDLVAAMYEKAGRGPIREAAPYSLAAKIVLLILAPPALLILLVLSAFWIGNGFKRRTNGTGF